MGVVIVVLWKKKQRRIVRQVNLYCVVLQVTMFRLLLGLLGLLGLVGLVGLVGLLSLLRPRMEHFQGLVLLAQREAVVWKKMVPHHKDLNLLSR